MGRHRDEVPTAALPVRAARGIVGVRRLHVSVWPGALRVAAKHDQAAQGRLPRMRRYRRDVRAPAQGDPARARIAPMTGLARSARLERDTSICNTSAARRNLERLRGRLASPYVLITRGSIDVRGRADC